MLAGNPLLLTMMAILNRNQELPRDRVDLYAQATRLLLHQWDTERALAEFPGLSTDIGWREKHDLLRRVASFMQAGPSGLKGNMIDGPTLTTLIEDYLHTDLHFPQSRAAARAVVEHLRQRNFILCFVGADSYGFVHRTFLEYFCAADFVHEFNIAKTLDEAGLLSLFDQHCRDDDWREVLRLICSQIDDQFVGQIVERLAMRTNLDEWDGSTPVSELPLAILCLSEARNLARIEKQAVILLSKTIGIFVSGNRPPQDFIEDIVSASGEIGDRWPGRLSIEFPISLNSSEYFHHWNWPKFIAVVTADRRKVIECAMQGTWDIRRGACESLAKHWPDESTRELLRARAVEDQDADSRGVACSVFGGMHSEFGRIVGTKDLDGNGPYLDHLKPLSREHIQRAAERAGIAAGDLEAQIASLNQHLGWDIRVGAPRPAVPPAPQPPAKSAAAARRSEPPGASRGLDDTNRG